MHGGKRAGAGRKPTIIDLGELAKVCGLQCTDEDVAGFFGGKVRTIERRRQKDPAFAAVMERGRAKGRISVRHGLFVQASKGNTAALIFLAKSLQSCRDTRSKAVDKGPPKNFVGTMEELLTLYRDVITEHPSDEEEIHDG
jgi:hypothetical protein